MLIIIAVHQETGTDIQAPRRENQEDNLDQGPHPLAHHQDQVHRRGKGHDLDHLHQLKVSPRHKHNQNQNGYLARKPRGQPQQTEKKLEEQWSWVGMT